MEHRKDSQIAINAGRTLLDVKSGEEEFLSVMGNFSVYVGGTKAGKGKRNLKLPRDMSLPEVLIRESVLTSPGKERMSLRELVFTLWSLPYIASHR